MIDEDLDEWLAKRSLEEGVSKAALIRRYVRVAAMPLPPLEDDPLWGMRGVDDYEPANVDDVVYPR
jgi:hypothetical protein